MCAAADQQQSLAKIGGGELVQTIYNCSRMMIKTQEENSLLMHFPAGKRNPNNILQTDERSCARPNAILSFSFPFSGLRLGQLVISQSFHPDYLWPSLQVFSSLLIHFSIRDNYKMLLFPPACACFSPYHKISGENRKNALFLFLGISSNPHLGEPANLSMP